MNDEKECASRVEYLLTHSAKTRELGRNAVEKVRRNFLITRFVKDELELFKTVTKSSTERFLQRQRQNILKSFKFVKKALSNSVCEIT